MPKSRRKGYPLSHARGARHAPLRLEHVRGFVTSEIRTGPPAVWMDPAPVGGGVPARVVGCGPYRAPSRRRGRSFLRTGPSVLFRRRGRLFSLGAPTVFAVPFTVIRPLAVSHTESRPPVGESGFHHFFGVMLVWRGVGPMPRRDRGPGKSGGKSGGAAVVGRACGPCGPVAARLPRRAGRLDSGPFREGYAPMFKNCLTSWRPMANAIR